MMSEERWAPIADFPGYYVSDFGRIKSTRACQGTVTKILKLQPGRYGKYQRICIRQNNTKKYVSVHSLVLECFVGPRNGRTVNHKNFNTHDNRLENLEWMSLSENLKHARLANRHAFGERHGLTKMTSAKVKQARDVYRSGKMSMERLAEKFGIAFSSMQLILREKTWKRL
jgi:hypothetical protein